MPNRLSGKVIVVTGGSRGFGFAVARACAREGAKVVVAARSAEAVGIAVNRLKEDGTEVSGFACDVTDLARVRRLAAEAIARYGHFDAWVNNAGVSTAYGPSAHVDPGAFRRAVDTIVYGTYHGSIVAMEHLLPRRSGKLVNVLGWGARKPIPYQNAYAASKAWVRNFSLALAEEYRTTGVGVYVIAPGMMPTELVTNVEAVAGFERVVQQLERVLPAIGRPPETAAERVVWLLSAATDGKTGLEVRTLGSREVALGFLRQGIGSVLRRPWARAEIDVTTVAPAIEAPVPPPNKR